MAPRNLDGCARHLAQSFAGLNGPGESFFEIRADAESCVIDMLAGPSNDALLCFPTRVLGTPVGGSAFTFTMFHAPGQRDEQQRVGGRCVEVHEFAA
jgi:hypothetical protein